MFPASLRRASPDSFLYRIGESFNHTRPACWNGVHAIHPERCVNNIRLRLKLLLTREPRKSFAILSRIRDIQFGHNLSPVLFRTDCLSIISFTAIPERMSTFGTVKKSGHVVIAMDKLHVMITSTLFFEITETLAGIIYHCPVNSSPMRIIPTNAEGSRIASHPN
jgi:hypothetical protein